MAFHMAGSDGAARGIHDLGFSRDVVQEDGVGDCVVVEEEVGDAIENAVGINVPRSVFHPTADHASDDPAGAETKIGPAPEVTSDTQSPALEPATPIARWYF